LLPGPFAPRSESANRTLANLLAGPFAPWPFHSLVQNESSCELSLPGTLVPGTFHAMMQDILLCNMRLTAAWWLFHCCLPNISNRDSLPDDVDERVTALVTYVNDNWISSRCAFQSSIRTNSDVEGWHNRLYQTRRRATAN